MYGITRPVFLFLKKRAFAFLLLSFLALRLGTLLTSVESVYWYDEGARGIIGKELIDGLKVPLWNYQGEPYNGGSLWTGVLAVPFFLLLGPNLFALKLVPLLFSLATLVLTYFFFKKFFDRKTALFASALLVLSPPVVTVISLVAIGSHSESPFFSIALLFLFYEFIYNQKRKIVHLILFGFTGGLGFWFAPITSLTLLTCWVSWFLLDRPSFLSSKMLIFLGALGMGLLPFVVYLSTEKEGMFEFLRYALLWGETSCFSLQAKLKSIPIRMVTFIFQSLPLIFRFRSFFGISGRLLSGLYGLGVMLIVIPFFWRFLRLKSAKLFPFLLYPVFFILVYVLSNFSVSFLRVYSSDEFRYFAPFYYFAFCLIALALRSQKSPTLFLSFFLGLGLVGQGSLLFKEPWGRAFHYQGYSYTGLGEIWRVYHYPFPKKFSQFQQLAQRYPEPERRFLYWGLGNYAGYTLDPHVLQDPGSPQA